VPLCNPAEELPLPEDGVHRIQEQGIVVDMVLVEEVGVGSEIRDDMHPSTSRPGGFESSSELTGQPSDLGIDVASAAEIFRGIHQVVQIVLRCYQKLVNRCNRGLAMGLSQLQPEGTRRSTSSPDGLDSGGPVEPGGIRRPGI
jgi:hypothetical protein